MLTVVTGYGQVDISGKVLDKSDKKPLTNASIVLLNADSILMHFTRADENGRFTLKDIDKGPYLMLVSYPKFELISKPLQVEDKAIKLDDIEVSSQMNLIEEVVVTQRIPIRIKGDTIEYDAASFETEKNAKLEDLLRRLPGLTVSADGQITAQGKSVSKVYIDGEEFFGYDNKIAIRNIRADAVDKVQVYERKSEEAELTGIDDGVRLQTVNVVLKEEARKGIFGNAEALYGTEDLYAGSLFAAKFNSTERIGITASTNNMGASGREGSLRMNNQIHGEPLNTSIGANYQNRLFQKKVNVNANYNFNNNSMRNERESYNKEILSDDVLNETKRTSNTFNTSQSHGVQSHFRIRIDSTQNMDVRLSGNISTRENGSSVESNTNDEGQNPINEFRSRQNNRGNSNSNNIRLNYRKRLNKNGASLNAHLSNSYSKSDTENDVSDSTYFFRNDSTVRVNQRRLGDDLSNNFSTQLSFNNRLTPKINYSIGYHFSNSNQKNYTDAFISDDMGVTSQIDTAYSQHQNDLSTNQGVNANMFFNLETITINVSNSTSYKNQNLDDYYRDIDLSRSFWDNSFNTDVNYKISTRKNIRVSYQHSNVIPTFGQLQPLQPQTNALFRQEGNPDLQRATRNSFRTNYNTISLLKGTSLNLNGDISFVSNPIINKREIDNNRITTSTFVNINDRSSWQASVNGGFNKPVFNKQVQFNVHSNLTYNNGFSYIRYNNANNYELNNLQNTNGSIGIGMNEQNSSGFDFDVNARIGANNQRNSLQKDFNYTNMTAGGSGYIKYFLPKQFNVTTNLVYSFEGPTKFYDESIHQFYTNVELSKKLLKSESLVVSVRAFDIFNTFNTINRNVSETNFSESTQLMLTRYVLFGLKWDFNKNLGKKKDE
ncbi:outer membrane beta-barrel protein [Sphingobacterium sp. SGG-5]|uniref:outer membrane beta-barrel protein n=1 Tax=Sphingobacterium sp. SGG-5 TaxID=2710881 RepID=UPI0019D1E8AF|nr:outer membrane beta-barrel protein [Sphingobacterium sp. SGG-5]